MQGALLRYRVMSFVTGTALILLYFVAIPLTLHHQPLFGKVIGVGHGVFLCPLYLLTVIQLAFLTKLRWWWWGLMSIAIVVPFLAFVMEHFVTKAIRTGATRSAVGQPGPVR